MARSGDFNRCYQSGEDFSFFMVIGVRVEEDYAE